MFTQTEDFLWKQVARAMKESTGFTMAQAGQAVEQMTGKSLEPNRPQKIRNSMIRHTETFAQNADGTWRVIREID
jgi:hypothetical protein